MLTLNILKAWLLALLVSTGDPGAPWANTYEDTAAAFAESAMASPIFGRRDAAPTQDDIRRTGALFVSVSWFESRHNPKAEGDGACLKKDGAGKCTERGPAHSFCLGQINDSNFPGLGITKEAILENTRVCVKAMNTLMRRSLRVCAAETFEYWLSWYTAGGEGCRVNKQSAHRMNKAKWLFDHNPIVFPELSATN